MANNENSVETVQVDSNLENVAADENKTVEQKPKQSTKTTTKKSSSSSAKKGSKKSTKSGTKKSSTTKSGSKSSTKKTTTKSAVAKKETAQPEIKEIKAEEPMETAGVIIPEPTVAAKSKSKTSKSN